MRRHGDERAGQRLSLHGAAAGRGRYLSKAELQFVSHVCTRRKRTHDEGAGSAPTAAASSTIQDCPKHWLPNSGWARSSSPPSRLSPLSGNSGGLNSVSPTFDVAPQQSCQIAWAPVLRRRDAHSKPLQSLAYEWRVECLGRCLIEPVDDRPGRPLREKKSAPDVDSYFRGALLPGGCKFGSTRARLGDRMAIAFTALP